MGHEGDLFVPIVALHGALGFINRCLISRILGNKKKFAQIGQCIREISQKPFSGTQGGSGAQKRVKECPKKMDIKIRFQHRKMGGYSQ